MKKKSIFFILGVFALDVLLSLPCDKNLACDGPSSVFFQYPRLWVLLLIPLSLFALILGDQKHRFWMKFTGVFFVISMLFVYIMPEYDPGIVSLDRELTNWFFVGLYSVVSIIYFMVQFMKNRKQSQV